MRRLATRAVAAAEAARVRSGVVCLGVETTCDETGVAVVRGDGTVLAASLASQWALQTEWKGVVPVLAAREHERNLPLLLERTMAEAGLGYGGIDVVAVSAGPGLAPCLRVGVEGASALCREHGLPLVAANHLEAHITVARLHDRTLEYPFLAALVSGGHTQLLRADGIGAYTLLGTTIDDAMGEAFDKAARLIGAHVGCESPGAAVERLAREGDADAVVPALPVPLARHRHDHRPCDFSFSGLKSALRRLVRSSVGPDGEVEPDSSLQKDLAAAFQRAAVAQLSHRTRRALKQHTDLRSVVLCGGVAANRAVREAMRTVADEAETEVRLVVPPVELCTDNAVMVAWLGLEKFALGHHDSPVGLTYNPRWPLGIIN